MSSSTARALEPEPDHAEELVDQVRRLIQVEDPVIKEARKRRDLVKKIAEAYLGFVRSYNSGSIAHGTAKNPLPDADAGSVLDRRSYPALGPDGAGEGPGRLMREMAAFLEVEIRRHYPKATVEVIKRAIKIDFNEPIDDEDPSVDLVLGLTRRDGPGLWIPNTEQDRWDASDPEKHTALLVADPEDLRVFRARLIRLIKVALGQDDPAVIISFNIEALALEHVTEVTGLAEGLRDLLRAMSLDISRRLTPDPAKVSPPIKLPEGVSHETASRRLAFFADRVAEAVEHTQDEQAVRRALAAVFPEQISGGEDQSVKGQFARALKSGNNSPAAQVALGAGTDRVKSNARSFGHARH